MYTKFAKFARLCWEQYNLLLDISLRYFITFSFKLLPEELLPGKKGQRRREKYM